MSFLLMMPRKMSEVIVSSLEALLRFSGEAISRRLEVRRLSQTHFTVLLAGSKPPDNVWEDNHLYILENQEPDGGWSDPEETAWVTAVLSRLSGKDGEVVSKAVNWLRSVRHSEGGWGRHPRDQVRIPTTALVIVLVPSVATQKDRAWIRQTWEKDLGMPVRLSYKGGFYLLTANSENTETIDPLVPRTIAYLAEDQNDDGGFGPWIDHPIGSDPWSTGVVLWGLSKWIDYVDPVIIEKALAWLEKTQLPSGYWAYHYLDEGTSYALIGAVSALRALKKL